ncbi:MAG: hypothetical protein AAGH64_11040, partial [Planctomycetota bacterium]
MHHHAATHHAAIDNLSGAHAHRARLGLAPERPWLDRLIRAYEVPEGVVGQIDPHDAAFLWDLIEATRADAALEIG